MFLGVTNTPRDYAWGSTTAIPELLGTEPTGAPQAELWLGAHPGSPARLTDGSGRTLHDVAQDLPFLLKVLAAASPLSLQAHPTPEQARAGFHAEEAAGVPADAPHRNYKDAFHKPELIYALSDPFRALCGFRAVEETRAVLAPVADDPRIAPLMERLTGDDAIRDVFEWLIEGGAAVDELVAAVVEASAVVDGPSWQTVRQLADAYPGDPGIAISLLINTVALSPGEVLYLPAGNIHAYLEGLGIELMAASDNVLRGGLTPKHVDVPQLLQVLDFRPLPVPYLRPEEPRPGVRVFRPDVPDFVLTAVDGEALRRGVELELDGPAIVLVADGTVEVDGGGTVARGAALFVQGEPSLALRGRGLAFVAAVGAPAPGLTD